MNERKLPLSALAHARSGDKGSGSNIGLIAYTKAGYIFLEQHLTADKVAGFFYALHPIQVKRYDIPNLLAFNFILEGVLAGGGSRSLRIDSQGKALGQAILEMPMDVSVDLYEELSKFQEVNHGI